MMDFPVPTFIAVVAGVIVAGFLMNAGKKAGIDLIKQASNGFDTGVL